jgi:hypothetical protein
MLVPYHAAAAAPLLPLWLTKAACKELEPCPPWVAAIDAQDS